jgi:hypothetical protein
MLEFARAFLLGHSRLAYILPPHFAEISSASHVKVHPFQPSIAEPQSVDVGELYAKLLWGFQIPDLPLYATADSLWNPPHRKPARGSSAAANLLTILSEVDGVTNYNTC